MRVRHTQTRCTVVAGCVYRTLRSVTHHLPLFGAALCVTDPRTLDGNVRNVWIKWEYPDATYIFDILCFSPGAQHRNLPQISDSKQRTLTALLQPPPTTTTSNSGPHHARVAGLWCSAVASCFIGGCGPSSIITTSLSLSLSRSLLCCCCAAAAAAAAAAAVHVCTVCRARREKQYQSSGWSRCPIMDLKARVRSSQRSPCLFCCHFFTFFCQLVFCNMYATQIPQTTNST